MLRELVTTLGPTDADDGDAGRRERGQAIASLCSITPLPIGYRVPSQSGRGDYVVSLRDEPFCSCPDWNEGRLRCKHIYAVENYLQEGEGTPFHPVYTGKPGTPRTGHRTTNPRWTRSSTLRGSCLSSARASTRNLTGGAALAHH